MAELWMELELAGALVSPLLVLQTVVVVEEAASHRLESFPYAVEEQYPPGVGALEEAEGQYALGEVLF